MAVKRKFLTRILDEQPEVAAPVSTPKARQSVQTSAAAARAPSRVGKKACSLFLSPEEHRILKMLAVEEDMPIERLIKTALNDLLIARGKATIDIG